MLRCSIQENKELYLPHDGKRKKAVVQHNLSRPKTAAFEKSKAAVFISAGGT